MLLISSGRLKAIIMDVDGTLYRQDLVRCAILWRLLRTYLAQPSHLLLTLRVLRAYRKAQEILRERSSDYGDLALAQERLTVEWTGVDATSVDSCVARWMQQEPLEVARRFLHKGLVDFLQTAKRHGMRLAALSDYPAKTKLEAMGLAHFFDVIASAQDSDIQKFKPDPRGLAVLLQRLRIEKHQTLYIGDRPEVDALAASNAGIPCVIIGRQWTAWMNQPGYIKMPSYRELKHAIFC